MLERKLRPIFAASLSLAVFATTNPAEAQRGGSRAACPNPLAASMAAIPAGSLPAGAKASFNCNGVTVTCTGGSNMKGGSPNRVEGHAVGSSRVCKVS